MNPTLCPAGHTEHVRCDQCATPWHLRTMLAQAADLLDRKHRDPGNKWLVGGLAALAETYLVLTGRVLTEHEVARALDAPWLDSDGRRHETREDCDWINVAPAGHTLTVTVTMTAPTREDALMMLRSEMPREGMERFVTPLGSGKRARIDTWTVA